MNAKEVAGLTGVSVRTLHHYDRIGLLCPRRNPDNGYREYTGADLDLLQQILFFRECGFPLSKIQTLLGSPRFDREKAYALQKKALLHEQQRIETMLRTLERTMQASKGAITMTPEEKFAGFDFNHNPYEEEARRLWGDAAVDQSSAYLCAMSPEGRNAAAKDFAALFTRLAALRGEAPDGAIAQQAMGETYAYFNENFGYHYTPEAFAGLGQLYVTDERFTRNIDQYGEGLSRFLAAAMAAYAKGR